MDSQREAFMAEILDHLDTLEREFLNFEELQGRETGDINAVARIHSMFRSAHSLKSSLGMAGFPVSSKMLHSMEHILDSHRNSGSLPADSELDSFLSALDVVRLNLESDTEQEFRIDASSANQGLDAPVRPAAASSSPKEKGGLWQIQKTVKSSLPEERFWKLPVFKTLESLGSLVEVIPKPGQWPEDQEMITLSIVFSSSLTLEELKEHIFDPLLPYAVPTGGKKEALPEDKAPVESGELKILIVEDDFTTRHLESAVLGKFGTCDVAVDGREALEAFREALQKGLPYDLVILDLLLPEISGLDVLSGIRSLEDDHGIAGLDRSRIAVVTTVAEHKSIRKSFADQADAYILKPVTRKKIQKELARLRILDSSDSTD